MAGDLVPGERSEPPPREGSGPSRCVRERTLLITRPDGRAGKDGSIHTMTVSSSEKNGGAGWRPP